MIDILTNNQQQKVAINGDRILSAFGLGLMVTIF